MSSLRAERVVKAFIGCVQAGIYTREYAVTLIEDNGRYGFLTEADKQEFYTACPAQATEELPGGSTAEPTQTPAEETDGTDN